MTLKHFTPNFERARTLTFVLVHILDVRERAPLVTPTLNVRVEMEKDRRVD